MEKLTQLASVEQRTRSGRGWATEKVLQSVTGSCMWFLNTNLGTFRTSVCWAEQKMTGAVQGTISRAPTVL